MIDKDNPIHIRAWIDFCNWALGSKELKNEYEKQTGIKSPEKRSGIEIMIDKVTGFDPNQFYVKNFIIWATENIWGDETNTPSIFYQEFKSGL
jgi:hypothetical protein